jgi:RNA polymerase sigma factor (sigma-70 family)
MDDAASLQSFADRGDEKAFADLVRRHTPFVYSVALRRTGGDTHLAEDISQEVFVDMGRKAGRLARHPALKAWLYTATRFAEANRVTSERRRRLREEAHTMHDLNRPETSAVEWDRVRPQLDEALDHLGERDRSAVVLRFFDGQSYGEIGRAQGISEDGARLRINRALDRLAAAFRRRGINSTAAGMALGLASETMAAVPPGVAETFTRAALGTLKASGALSGTSAGAFTVLSHSKAVLGLAALVLVVASVGWRERALVADRQRTLDSVQQEIRQESAEASTRSRKRSSAPGTVQSGNPALEDALTRRVGILRSWFGSNPGLVLPEFELLTDRDWVGFAYQHSEIDAGGDLWPVAHQLREKAIATAVPLIQAALKAYIASSTKVPLTDPNQLLPFAPSLDAAILARYSAFPDDRALAKAEQNDFLLGPIVVSHPEIDDLPGENSDGVESWEIIRQYGTYGSSRSIGNPNTSWP